ncbi:MAG: PP2C family serine/threonine-protein phosphatase [Planctomycetota bacterium]
MRLESHAITDPGPAGKRNDDTFYVDDAHGLYVVSDGLGRFKGADLASRTVVNAVVKAVLAGEPLDKAANTAARAVDARAKADPALKDMAATLTLLHVAGNRFEGVHVGDSRAYLFRADTLVQLTRDHSVAFEQYLAGAITKEQIRTNRNQAMLTRSVRAGRGFAATEPFGGEIRPGDEFLLCTDGLTKELTDAHLRVVLREPGSPKAHADALLEKARKRILIDNVTLIVARTASS